MELIPLDQYDLEKVRSECIGRQLSSSKGRYPIEYDPIRRHCHMVGDENPAFLDPEFAKTTDAGAVVVPPSMLAIYLGSGGPWPPEPGKSLSSGAPDFTMGVPTIGDRGINMGVEYDFLEPIRVGDRLRLETRIKDVFEKKIKLDPHAIWIVSETTVFNQEDREVVRFRNVVLTHRSPQQIEDDIAAGLNRHLGDRD